MKNNKLKFALFIVGVVVLVVALGFVANKPAGPSKYDTLAQCINDSGAEFYGAFWCPHCQEQKAIFGSSKKYLPYIECSNPDQSQTQICKDKEITGYPTWIFKDGTRVGGSMTIESLAEATSCPLPEEVLN